jgi:broad specificity phosphatase PhoE
MRHVHESPRAYEARHFPAAYRLDLHADGPQAARRRALRWIELMAHEHPGDEVLLVVERGGAVRREPGAVRLEVEALLDELDGALIDRWQRFGTDGVAVRISPDPDRFREPEAAAEPELPEGSEKPEPMIDPTADIPAELRGLVRRGAELRRMREGHGVALMDTLMRRIWIAAQAAAMSGEGTVEHTLGALVEAEERATYLEDEGGM